MEFNRAYDPIRALQSSWKALAQAPLPLLLGGFLLLIAGGGSGGGGNLFSIGRHGGDPTWETMRPILIPIVLLLGCMGIALFLFSSWIQIGFANTVEEVLRTGHTEADRLFQAKGRFGSMVLSKILCVFVGFLAVVPMILLVVIAAVATHGFHRNEGLALMILIPGGLIWLPACAYVVLGISLADQAVALEGLQPVDSIKRSWSLVSGHRLMLLLYFIVTGIFSAVGVCLCCIGVIVTGTMALTARSESYLALVRGSERAGWWIEHGGAAPPTPPMGWGTPPTSPPPPAPAV